MDPAVRCLETRTVSWEEDVTSHRRRGGTVSILAWLVEVKKDYSVS